MASLAQGRRFASPEVRNVVLTRLGQLSGIAFTIAALLLLVALASYNPHDPSLNTATSRPATNWAGPPGALCADVLLQGFGAAAVLPSLAMLAWGFRIATRRPLRLAVRLLCTILALPVLAAALATVPGPAWPTAAGPGGALGRMLADYAGRMGYGLLGPAGTALVLGTGVVLALILVVLSLGLSAGEWRAAGQARWAQPAVRCEAAGTWPGCLPAWVRASPVLDNWLRGRPNACCIPRPKPRCPRSQSLRSQ